ncbi:Helix-turn-helix domain-containing protein [Clostridium amylolyticum]|uniref:Helix-turn-helix domain-containing protein n=1 Tax=Clostridium amylolyticum TaxID=1121298 RepID=A0A1M6EPD6_9CLOT|nr:helix-turn-helix transcriptional regulator [Clostridium amylolyticum]SHI87150.1 Helix-turn-helix domain-containing protein [Clostridium amylolyticum]
MSRVGERVKAARSSSNMSQKQLAKKLGVAESFIADVELGRKIMNEGMINRISKVLNVDLNDVNMLATDEDLKRENEVKRASAPPLKGSKSQEETKDIWNQAFGSVLKNVPVYDYSLNVVKSTRQLPVHSNKIEGHSADKVFYIEIEDEDMIGYRIAKGDIALAYSIKELENNSICLMDYNDKRAVRQVKKLDNTKVLIISNSGTVKTETAAIKDIKPIAKLVKLEIVL